MSEEILEKQHFRNMLRGADWPLCGWFSLRSRIHQTLFGLFVSTFFIACLPVGGISSGAFTAL